NQLAREAYESARYDDAIEIWLTAAPYAELSADTLYHIGNACYRAGSTGHAALYYRRALARDPQHAEARQNLRFIERKVGSLSIKHEDYQYLIARLPLEAWRSATWGGIWLCVLSVLCFPATRRGAHLRQVAIAALVISPLLAVGGGLGWHYYPRDAAFAAIEDQAVIITPGSQLYSDASRNAPPVIQAPPGSLCEVLHQTGEWTYVAFASGTRGWVPSSSIRSILPDKAPELPRIPKPVADETNA
ncbi:MAG: hypothetical protein R3242_06430, partial [Akkermansiaceae bacterium]|nr:hypothetical protein [Akkermansiaceae bacterium]